jgi:hypothetical protein
MVSAWWANTKDTLLAGTIDVFYSSGLQQRGVTYVREQACVAQQIKRCLDRVSVWAGGICAPWACGAHRRGFCAPREKWRMCAEGHVSPRGEGVCVPSEE